MKEIEVDGNISSIIVELKKELFCWDAKEIWFRGHSNYSYKLMPSIFRNDINKAEGGQSYDEVIMYDEAEIYNEFIRRCPEHSSNHNSVFEWLTLMQHYRLPTRILDWTTNLLVALFFCCNEDKDRDGAVFAFVPVDDLSIPYDFIEFLEIQVTSSSRLTFYERLAKIADIGFGEEAKINGITIKDIKSSDLCMVNVVSNVTREFSSFCQKINFVKEGYYERIHDFRKIYTYKPPHLNPRIRQQHGCFTFHGGKYFEGSEFIKVLQMEDQVELVKIKVKHDDKQKLLAELALSGISEATLFPEMEYQANQIKNLYRTSYKLLPDTNYLY